MMDIYELDASLRTLTPHQLKLLQALYDTNGQWVTRIGIARLINKNRLTPYDIECLKLLNDMALIDMDKRPTNAPGSDFAYIYTMNDTVAEGLQNWYESTQEEEASRRRKPIKLISE